MEYLIEEKIRNYERILSRKNERFILSGEWDKWDENKRDKLLNLEKTIDVLSRKQTEIEDQCLKEKNWDKWYEFDEKIKKLNNEIKSINEELEGKILFAMVVLDLEKKMNFLKKDYEIKSGGKGISGKQEDHSVA